MSGIPKGIPAISITCVLIALLGGGPLVAQDCAEYEGHLAWAGGVDTPGTATWVTVAGDYAYVADGTAGVQIFDLANPTLPALVRTVDTPGTATALVVQGDYVYVADDAGGLQIIDVSVPASASIVASLVVAHSQRVAVTGGLLALGGWAYYSLVDISIPTAPVLIGTFDDLALDVAFAGGYLYTAAGVTGLKVIDVSVPASPTLVTIAAPGYTDVCSSTGVGAITVSGTVGCLRSDKTIKCGYTDSKRIIVYPKLLTIKMLDLSNPAAPAIKGVIGTASDHALSTIDGTVLFTVFQSESTAWLDVRDITDLAAPVRIGRLTGIGRSSRVDLAGGYAYVAETGMGLQVYDVSPPTSPSALIGGPRPSGAMLTVGGDLAYYIEPPYAGQPWSVVRWLDLRSASGTGFDATTRWSSDYYGLGVSGCYVFATWAHGLDIIDMSDPSAPTTSTWMFDAGSPAVGRILINGDYAYVPWSGGMLVLDVSNPLAPVLVGSRSGSAMMAISAGYLYAATSSQLRVFDLSNAEDPQFVGYLPAGFEVIRATPQLLLGGKQNTLSVYDLRDPASPALLGSLTLRFAVNTNIARSISDIQVLGDVAYVAVRNGGLSVVDLSNPMRPRLVGESDLVTAEVLASYEGHLLVSDGSKLDTMLPECSDLVPVYLSGFAAQREATGVRLSWKIAGAADAGDFRVVGRSGPNTWEVGCAPDGAGGFVALDNSPRVSQPAEIDYELWHRDAAGGWEQIGSTSCSAAALPARTCLREVHPNPFNPSTTVSFALDRAQEVRLSIYDLKGREVAVLAQGRWPAGEHMARWDGTDARGRPQPSGVYLVELRGQTTREARKIALSR